ncbi:SlyX family protein [Bordetella genomosp. 13]|uniref:SlyX family protein n=1 Tax=Bordetella genomosp. 13 TaxID=463040 RepID=UPI0011A56B09|nr:SlyX family protein [Bordetella genomosp. 13]
MDTQDDTERRLTQLEIKAGFADDLLDQLNQTVYRQQQQIELLMRELLELRNQAAPAGAGQFRSLRDELPPHY